MTINDYKMTTNNNKMTIFIRSIRLGYGLHPKYLKEVIGKVAKKDLEKETQLYFKYTIGITNYI
jgi:sialic acid synthase SpsE